jgi:hypothetical protein
MAGNRLLTIALRKVSVLTPNCLTASVNEINVTLPTFSTFTTANIIALATSLLHTIAPPIGV